MEKHHHTTNARICLSTFFWNCLSQCVCQSVTLASQSITESDLENNNNQWNIWLFANQMWSPRWIYSSRILRADQWTHSVNIKFSWKQLSGFCVMQRKGSKLIDQAADVINDIDRVKKRNKLFCILTIQLYLKSFFVVFFSFHLKGIIVPAYILYFVPQYECM